MKLFNKGEVDVVFVKPLLGAWRSSHSGRAWTHLLILFNSYDCPSETHWIETEFEEISKADMYEVSFLRTSVHVSHAYSNNTTMALHLVPVLRKICSNGRCLSTNASMNWEAAGSHQVWRVSYASECVADALYRFRSHDVCRKYWRQVKPELRWCNNQPVRAASERVEEYQF